MNPKMDHPAYAGGVTHQAQRFLPIKPGKEVIGEQGFCNPNRSFPRRAPKANAWEKNFHVFPAAQAGCGDVLMFGLGTQAKPCYFWIVRDHLCDLCVITGGIYAVLDVA
jgi:hypothetical protein